MDFPEYNISNFHSFNLVLEFKCSQTIQQGVMHRRHNSYIWGWQWIKGSASLRAAGDKSHFIFRDQNMYLFGVIMSDSEKPVIIVAVL